MRMIACMSLLMVAACGGGDAGQEEAAPKAQSLSPGQWETTSEVIAFQTVDDGAPKIDTPVGTQTTETICVAEERPPTALFSGEGYDCRYDNYYLRNGRLNMTLQCVRDGLSGSIPMTIDGTFEEESFEFNRGIRTVLATDGDVRITARVAGRRTGECVPEGDAGNRAG